MPKLHALLIAATNDGWWAGALIAALTTIGGGAWKLLSDSTNRVDASGKEQRDRLEAELARKDVELARKEAENVALRTETAYWRDRYLDDPSRIEDDR